MSLWLLICILIAALSGVTADIQPDSLIVIVNLQIILYLGYTVARCALLNQICAFLGVLLSVCLHIKH